MKNCRCSKNLLTFPKDITKLDFIKDWIDWAEPIIKEIDTKIIDLETWKTGIDSDVSYIQSSLSNFALKMHTHTISQIIDLENVLLNINRIKEGDDRIEISGDGINGEIIINLHSKGDQGETLDNEFLIDSNDLYNILYPEDTPLQNSSKLITSRGVYKALQNIPSSPTDNIISENGTGLSVVDGAFNGVIKNGSTTKYITITKDNVDNLNNTLNSPDTVPTSNSSKLITSGGVYDALSQIENTTSIPIIYRVLDDSVMSIEIDSLFPVGGSNRVTLIIKNATSGDCDIIDINNGYLYSNNGYPIHMAKPFNNAQTSESPIPTEGYMILNLYKIDLTTFKDEVAENTGSTYFHHYVDHGSDPSLLTCYFITLGGVFESVA